MPLGYEYKRYFIILQEEDKGYEMTAGKIPTGYVKIEIKKDKVKIRGFIQNTISDTKSKYRLNLLAPKKKLILDMGLFRMDNNGRGEFYAEFDSDNVNNSNTPISEFTGAIIVAGSGVPLAGYLDRESIPWREWRKKEEKRQQEETVEEKISEEDRLEIDEAKRDGTDKSDEDSAEVRVEDGQEERNAEKAEPMEDLREEKETNDLKEKDERQDWQGEPETQIDRTTVLEEGAKIIDNEEQLDIIEEGLRDKGQDDEFSEMEMRVEPAPLYYEEPDYTERNSFHETDFEGLMNENEETVRQRDERKKSKLHNKLFAAINNMEKYDGFHGEDDIEWYRIGRKLPLLNEVIIPINGAMMPLSYPYISETNGRNIGNCVLGVEWKNGEIRYVYIGIPGIYNEACRLCYEYRGFTEFKRIKNKRKGYWIMCIDIKRGKVCTI